MKKKGFLINHADLHVSLAPQFTHYTLGSIRYDYCMYYPSVAEGRVTENIAAGNRTGRGQTISRTYVTG